VPENAGARVVRGELLRDQRAQLLRDIRIHPVVTRPWLRRGIDIETRADTKVPCVAVPGQFDAARTGVRCDQHQPELGGDALCAGLDHEGLFRARESGEVIQHRHRSRLRLRGREYCKTHGAGGARGLVAIEADRTAEAAMPTDDFERLAGHGFLLQALDPGIALRSPCSAQARGGHPWPPVRRMRGTLPGPARLGQKARFFARGSATCGGGARPSAWSTVSYSFMIRDRRTSMSNLYRAPAGESPRVHRAMRLCHVAGTGLPQPPPSARYSWTR